MEVGRLFALFTTVAVSSSLQNHAAMRLTTRKPRALETQERGNKDSNRGSKDSAYGFGEYAFKKTFL